MFPGDKKLGDKGFAIKCSEFRGRPRRRAVLISESESMQGGYVSYKAARRRLIWFESNVNRLLAICQPSVASLVTSLRRTGHASIRSYPRDKKGVSPHPWDKTDHSPHDHVHRAARARPLHDHVPRTARSHPQHDPVPRTARSRPLHDHVPRTARARPPS